MTDQETTPAPAVDAAAAPAAEPATSNRVLGIDLGAQKCVVSLSSEDSSLPEILLNEVSNMSTPNCVAVNGKERFAGDAALGQVGTNIKNSVQNVTSFLGLTPEQASTMTHCPVKFTQDADGKTQLQMAYNGDSDAAFYPEQVMSVLLKFLAAYKPHNIDDTYVHTNKVVLAVPGSFNEVQHRAILDAAKIAGVDVVKVVSTATAVTAMYTGRHGLHVEKKAPAAEEAKEGDAVEGPRTVLFVDVGHKYLSVHVAQYTEGQGKVLACAVDEKCGSSAVDQALYDHCVVQIKDQKKLEIAPGSKAAYRLMRECEKTKKVLSTINETPLQIEALQDDIDVRINISKAELENMIAHVPTRVTELITEVLATAGVTAEDLSFVEVVGGGTRVPAVSNAIATATGKPLSKTLDSASAVAVGAALLRPVTSDKEKELVIDAAMDEPAAVAGLGDAGLEAAVAKEAEMAALDAMLKERGERFNELESYIYHMRSECSGKFSKMLDSDTLMPKLTQEEDWLFEDGEEANAEQLSERLAALKEYIKYTCTDYYNAMEEERLKMEAELEKLAKEREAEPKDDHDTRKLKKEDRMRLATKNKEEGTELFKDKNYEHAAQRYIKSLTHCEKFFDLSPDDIKEVDALKLSLHLNLAMCFLKIEKWPKVIDNCNAALKLDENSAKALFRRAQAYEATKDYDAAKKDLKAALKHQPDDKAIKNSLAKVEHYIQKQLEKEKKMYGNMFG
eukprot:GFYU01006269.1.p1 GENE.GFYU01006269.1~~GFYU01006269.1.p1  ORF type:complete len:733 (-),score=300.70 GFYU01006269.1:144-2342(-)